MAANLVLKFLRSAVYHSLEQSYRNETGTPIVSVALAGNNLQRSSIYDLTFSNVIPGVSATVKVATPDPHNPSRDSVGKTVALDGTTVHKNIVEGLGIVFSSSGSFNDSWLATIYYGTFFDTADSQEISVLYDGTITAGATAGTDRVVVENVGSDLAADCTVRVVNGVRYVNGATDVPFLMHDYTEVSQTSNFSPGHAITFANQATGVIDIRVNGLTYDVKRLDTGVVFPGGAGVPRDGLTWLEFTGGPLTGWRFVLATSTVNASTATVYVSDAAVKYEIAPDLAGSPGTWQPATTPLQLTQDGGSNLGEIAAGMRAFFHQRVKTLTSDSPIGNERHARYILRSLTV